MLCDQQYTECGNLGKERYVHRDEIGRGESELTVIPGDWRGTLPVSHAGQVSRDYEYGLDFSSVPPRKLSLMI